jgi:hypothetical protein
LSKSPYNYKPITAVTTITRSASAGTAATATPAAAVRSIATATRCAGRVTAAACAAGKQQRHSFKTLQDRQTFLETVSANTA